MFVRCRAKFNEKVLLTGVRIDFRRLVVYLVVALSLFTALGCSSIQPTSTIETNTGGNAGLQNTEPNQPSETISIETKAVTDSASTATVRGDADLFTPEPSHTATTMPTETNTVSDHESSSATKTSLAAIDTIGFARNYIDTKYGGNGKPGWVRAADMDKDGDLDIVAGGGFALFIYENDGNTGGWRRYGNLDSTGKMGANGAVLYDVDGDGDIDVAAAKYYNDLGWWENPGGTLSNTPWAFHKLGETSWYLHDIIRVDLDQDGVAAEFVVNLNEGYWDTPAEIKWFRPGSDPEQLWEVHTIDSRNPGSNHGHAGLDVGDIDQDGHLDLAFSYGWYQAPDDPAGAWAWHAVTDIYGVSNALIRDMDADGQPDLVMSAGHHGQGVFWFENPGEPYTDGWTRHDISSVVGDVTKRHKYIEGAKPEHLHHPECLGVLDLDGDNDQDIVTCELFFGEDPGEPGWNEQAHHVYVFENVGNSSVPVWDKQNVAPNSYPSHLLQMVDINQDGQMDIISEGAGYSVVSYYENMNGVP